MKNKLGKQIGDKVVHEQYGHGEIIKWSEVETGEGEKTFQYIVGFNKTEMGTFINVEIFSHDFILDENEEEINFLDNEK